MFFPLNAARQVASKLAANGVTETAMAEPGEDSGDVDECSYRKLRIGVRRVRGVGGGGGGGGGASRNTVATPAGTCVPPDVNGAESSSEAHPTR